MAHMTTKDELKLLRSALAGLVGRDREGVYRPAFVREMFASLKRSPEQKFTSSEAFVKEVQRMKE